MIVNSARRFFEPLAQTIPQRSTTYIAAVRLPEPLHAAPSFDGLADAYARKIFAAAKHPFDMRVCIRDFPFDDVISDYSVFEELDFSRTVAEVCQQNFRLGIRESGRMDGFLLWVNMAFDEEASIDILRERHTLLPIFFPVFYPGIEVEAGDVIEAVCDRRPCTENLRNPDYRISGTLVTNAGKRISFRYRSPNFERSFSASPFYEKLFAQRELDRNVAPRESRALSTRDLLRGVSTFLPEHMRPSDIVVLDALPLTSNGKIDREALPLPGSHVLHNAKPEYPSTPTERMVAGIWGDVLGEPEIDIHSDFFDIGGHSLLATQVAARLEKQMGIVLPVRVLFEARTVQTLAQELDKCRRQAATDDSLATKAGIEEELEQMIAEVESLPEEQVQKLLTEQVFSHNA